MSVLPSSGEAVNVHFIDSMQQRMARVDALLARFDESTRPLADEMMSAMLEIYGEGFRRLLGAVRDTSEDGGMPVLERIVDDPFVSSLLVLHDLHPLPLRTRIERALESVRPFLHAHKGEVDFVKIGADGVVDVRLFSTSDGPMYPSIALEKAISRAVRAAAPEIASVRVTEAA